MVKPFDRGELAASSKALCRRVAPPESRGGALEWVLNAVSGNLFRSTGPT